MDNHKGFHVSTSEYKTFFYHSRHHIQVLLISNLAAANIQLSMGEKLLF